MRRLFGCTVQLTYKANNGETTVNAVIADRTEFWWNKPDERTLWDNKIELSEKFFNEIIHHPVPLDMNILTALKRCSLGLDLYLWLTYRTFSLRAPLRLSWRQLYCQFEANPDKASDKQTVKFLPAQGSPRIEEDQDGLAGSELLHGSGRIDPLAHDSRDPINTRAVAPRGIAFPDPSPAFLQRVGF